MGRYLRHITLAVPSAALLAISLVGSTAARGADGSAAPKPPAQCKLETLWTAQAASASHSKVRGVPNFGKVNDHVWRSGQPTAEGYKNLAAMGLKTVVNLRGEISEAGDPTPAGVKQVYIPIHDQNAPTVEQAEQVLAVVQDPANWPVLIHCQGGQGRAGLMCALVRYSFDGWDSTRITRETESFRKPAFLFVKLPMAGCQRRFIEDWEAKHQAGDYLQHMVTAP